ncbi:MAG: response regulator [Pirellulaceae bacterium]|nr:response regulator [Pirellulaceae bacterium]
MNKEQVLLVDDDPNVGRSLQRQLRKLFRFDVATSGAEALELLRTNGPYAVVVSDMKMPNMNGLELLSEITKVSPNTVRIMLTGNADQRTAVDAVNEGQVFQFLCKPCPAEKMAKTLEQGLEQYRLITAEKDLISKTLTGSVKVLTDVLSMACPEGFSVSNRIRPLARSIGEILDPKKIWEYEIAAMLSQIGCVTVDEEIIVKMARGEELTPKELVIYNSHALAGQKLIGNIARLEGAAEAVGYQLKHFNGKGVPGDDRTGESIPLGGRILRVLLEYDHLVQQGKNNIEAIMLLKQQQGMFDPNVLDALQEVLHVQPQAMVRYIPMGELMIEMILADHIQTDKGTILISKGQKVSESLLMKLKNHARSKSIKEPIAVLELVNMNEAEEAEPLREAREGPEEKAATQQKD